jgi:hypothetical protein
LPSLLKDKRQNVLQNLWDKVKTDDLNINLDTYKKLLNDPCELIIDTCKDEQGKEIVKIETIGRFSNAFNYIVKVYYGLNNLNIADEVFQSILKAIKDNYPEMTFSNLNLAFVNGVEKKQGSGLTRDEFMLPIHAFMAKKKRIESLLQDIELKEHNERIEQENAKKFIEHSMDIYNKSKGTGRFIGTPFEANVIVDDFIDLLNDDELRECHYRSNKLFKEQQSNNEVSPFSKLVKSNRNKGEEIETSFKLYIPEKHLLAKEIMDMVVFKHNTNK